MFTHEHGVKRKLKLGQLFSGKVAWNSPEFFAMVDYVGEMTAEKSHVHGEYEMSEQFHCLLF